MMTLDSKKHAAVWGVLKSLLERGSTAEQAISIVLEQHGISINDLEQVVDGEFSRLKANAQFWEELTRDERFLSKKPDEMIEAISAARQKAGLSWDDAERVIFGRLNTLINDKRALEPTIPQGQLHDPQLYSVNRNARFDLLDLDKLTNHERVVLMRFMSTLERVVNEMEARNREIGMAPSDRLTRSRPVEVSNDVLIRYNELVTGGVLPNGKKVKLDNLLPDLCLLGVLKKGSRSPQGSLVTGQNDHAAGQKRGSSFVPESTLTLEDLRTQFPGYVPEFYPAELAKLKAAYVKSTLEHQLLLSDELIASYLENRAFWNKWTKEQFNSFVTRVSVANPDIAGRLKL